MLYENIIPAALQCGYAHFLSYLNKSKMCVRVVYSFWGWFLGDWLASISTMTLGIFAFAETDWNSGLILASHQPWNGCSLVIWLSKLSSFYWFLFLLYSNPILCFSHTYFLESSLALLPVSHSLLSWVNTFLLSAVSHFSLSLTTLGYLYMSILLYYSCPFICVTKKILELL